MNTFAKVIRLLRDCWKIFIFFTQIQGGPKSEPLPNDQKIVLNRIKAYQW